jgi:hypothetical protein
VLATVVAEVAGDSVPDAAGAGLVEATDDDLGLHVWLRRVG